MATACSFRPTEQPLRDAATGADGDDAVNPRDSPDGLVIPDGWWNPAWTKRSEIEIDNTNVSAELDDFPVLVTLTPATFDYGSSTGTDVRFVAADNTTTLAYDVDTFVETVVRIAPTFGGIHLEDISAPECFEIERRLIERLPQPVMHDDVHGTAVVSLAAAIVACRYAGVELRAATVGQLGLGAAGYGIAGLMVDGGVKRVIAFDPLEASHARARTHGVEIVTMEQVMSEADVVVATTGRAGLIAPTMIRPGQVILALTNPDPEIEPEVALAAGAAFAADGRSVNNVVGYPGIFRGALQAGAASINVDMKLAAARAIAELAPPGELVPNALDQAVHDAVADAVRIAATTSGIARPGRAASSTALPQINRITSTL